MKYIKIILSSFLSLVLFSCMAQTANSVTADEFEKDIAKDSIQLLDVRTPGEYFSGHIKNALQADWNDPKEFDRRIVFIDKSKPVYVYCLAGGRSAAAADKMRKMGYANVIELKGGINAWKAANKSLIGKTPGAQMSIETFNGMISSAKTVLVDFGAEWCPPCKTMDPIIKELETSSRGKYIVVKVDGGNDEEITKAYKVTALPVFLIFKDGKLFWRNDGVVSKKTLTSQLLSQPTN